MAKLSIESQIAEMEYVVVAMRKWHAHAVNARHVKRDVADLHEEHELAILDTLRWFEDHQDEIRGMFAAKRLAEATNAQNDSGVDRRDP
jgi:hypothetical protein